MAEDRESSDRKSEKSKKRDRGPSVSQNWTGEEKLQLAEAIDMYGIRDIKRLMERVPTKMRSQLESMIKHLGIEYRKETQVYDMKTLSFVDLNKMDDLFLVGGTKPKDALLKWMDYLDSFYMNDAFKYNKFKLFSKAFLILAECSPEPKTNDQENDHRENNEPINFRKVYYYLYRMFNNYYIAKSKNEEITKKYLNNMFMHVLDDIEYSSDDEKMAMYDIVNNWTSVNRKNVRVYGKPKPDAGEVKAPDLVEPPKFKVLQQPMVPCFNPLRMKSNFKYPLDQ